MFGAVFSLSDMSLSLGYAIGPVVGTAVQQVIAVSSAIDVPTGFRLPGNVPVVRDLSSDWWGDCVRHIHVRRRRPNPACS